MSRLSDSLSSRLERALNFLKGSKQLKYGHRGANVVRDVKFQ